MFSMVLVGSVSFDTDPDPDSGSSHFLIRIRIQGNDTDSMDPDLQHCQKVQLFSLTKKPYQTVAIAHYRIAAKGTKLV